jgi:hypothetical protein
MTDEPVEGLPDISAVEDAASIEDAGDAGPASLEYREWTDNQGGPHSKHEVIGSQVDFLDKPPAAGDAAPDYAPGEEPF